MKKLNRKKLYRLLVIKIGMLLFLLMFYSCSNTRKKEISQLKDIVISSSADTLVENNINYIVGIVQYQQKVQVKNPKRIDIDLLTETIEYSENLSDNNNEIANNILFNINVATLYMFSASYHSSKGDIVEASYAVDQAMTIFDAFIEKNPDNVLVRGYRGLNYSNLPSIFSVEDKILEDTGFLVGYIENRTEFSDFQNNFFLEALLQLEEYFNKIENNSMSSRIEEILNQKFQN